MGAHQGASSTPRLGAAAGSLHSLCLLHCKALRGLGGVHFSVGASSLSFGYREHNLDFPYHFRMVVLTIPRWEGREPHPLTLSGKECIKTAGTCCPDKNSDNPRAGETLLVTWVFSPGCGSSPSPLLSESYRVAVLGSGPQGCPWHVRCMISGWCTHPSLLVCHLLTLAFLQPAVFLEALS